MPTRDFGVRQIEKIQSFKTTKKFTDFQNSGMYPLYTRYNLPGSHLCPLIENYSKTFNYSRKESSVFYMALREMKIHRERLDKEILADRAQLFHPKI